MIEYSDFECPFCARFTRQTLPGILHDYVETGRVALAFHHLPLDIHPQARAAAAASMCVAQQDKFWRFQELLFQRQPDLSPDSLEYAARTVGADLGLYRSCVRVDSSDTIEASIKSAQNIGIRTTPTFVIGRLRAGKRVAASAVIVGSRPAQEFAQALDKAIRESRQ
jgi:protein-disulfide isomerase